MSPRPALLAPRPSAGVCPGSLILSLDESTSQYPFKFNPAYGSLEDLKELVRTAHQYGIFVIMDVNWSLFTSSVHLYNYDLSSKTYDDWGPYFMSLLRNAAPSQRNRLNTADKSRSREYVIEFIESLYNDFGIDGLNFQNLKCFRRTGANCDEEGAGDIESAITLLRTISNSFNIYLVFLL